MKHKHHIIPRHAGGTDDPSNLVELTVAEHAQAHKELYEQHGRTEDYLAWKGLEGSVDKAEILWTLSKERRGEKHHYWGIKRPDHAITMRERMSGEGNPMFGKTPWNKGITVPADKTGQGECKARPGNTNGAGNLGIKRTPEQNAANSEKMKRIWAERRALKELNA